MFSQSSMVSIVIPHFNREREIKNSLSAIIRQEYKNWECLIIDDGSKETSQHDLKKFIQKLNTEKIFYHQRPESREKGANACRNLGVELAKGDYIAFLDSDDSWPENYLFEAIKFAERKENFCASYSGAIVTRNNKKKIMPSRMKTQEEGMFDFLLSPGVLAQTSSYFLKQEIARKIKFDEKLQRHQDYDFFIRLGEKHAWVYNPYCITEIDWSSINQRHTDFGSCIEVYKRHENEFKNKKLKEGYLISLMGLALKNNAETNFINFLQHELRKTGYATKPGLVLMINFPTLYKLYVRVRKFFIEPEKQFKKFQKNHASVKRPGLR